MWENSEWDYDVELKFKSYNEIPWNLSEYAFSNISRINFKECKSLMKLPIQLLNHKQITYFKGPRSERMIDPPIEICNAGWDAIEQYLKEKEKGEEI